MTKQVTPELLSKLQAKINKFSSNYKTSQSRLGSSINYLIYSGYKQLYTLITRENRDLSSELAVMKDIDYLKNQAKALKANKALHHKEVL